MAAEPAAPPGARRDAPREKSLPSPGDVWLKQVYQDDRTSPMRYMVAVAIRMHCYGSKIECFPGQTTLAKMARTSTRTVRTEIAALIECGHLASANFPAPKQPRRNRYRLTLQSEQGELPFASDTLADDAPNRKRASCLRMRPNRKRASSQIGSGLPPNSSNEFYNPLTTVVSPPSARASAGDRPSEEAERPQGADEGFQDLLPSAACDAADEHPDLAGRLLTGLRPTDEDEGCTMAQPIGPGDIARIEAKCRIIVGAAPAAAHPNFGPIAQLLRERATEGDVINGVRVAMSKPGFWPRSWAVFSGFVRQEQTLRAAANEPPSSNRRSDVRDPLLRAYARRYVEALAEEALAASAEDQPAENPDDEPSRCLRAT